MPTLLGLWLLASPSLYRVEESVLSHPTCIARLMELAAAERALVRGEVLGLLIQLTWHNEHVQNIVAFEGAFDRRVDSTGIAPRLLATAANKPPTRHAS